MYDVRVGLWGKLSTKELLLLNCGVGEDSWVLWTARRSNQLILKEINTEYSLEGLVLKLKLQYFGHLMRRADYWKRPWCWERLRARGEGSDRGWDGWMASLSQWTWVWASSGRWWRAGKPGVLQFMGSQGVEQDLGTERHDNILCPLWARHCLKRFKYSKEFYSHTKFFPKFCGRMLLLSI